MLSQKCAIWILESFTKIYSTRNQYPLVLKSLSDGISTYKLLSLGYKITDRHLPRGFVTSKKPNIVVLCDFIYCDRTDDSINGSVLACRHGYYSYCLQRCQYKCLICLNYLQNEVKKNVDALIASLTKEGRVENESINENIEDADEDDLSNTKQVTHDMIATENLLERTKTLFLEL
jgi:hypothetical protein